jgi:hypothetical protein
MFEHIDFSIDAEILELNNLCADEVEQDQILYDVHLLINNKF